MYALMHLYNEKTDVYVNVHVHELVPTINWMIRLLSSVVGGSAKRAQVAELSGNWSEQVEIAVPNFTFVAITL